MTRPTFEKLLLVNESIVRNFIRKTIIGGDALLDSKDVPDSETSDYYERAEFLI
jgi:hypothetical protein